MRQTNLGLKMPPWWGGGSSFFFLFCFSTECRDVCVATVCVIVGVATL